MKCPKAVIGQWELGHKPQFSYGDCIKEQCGVWDKPTERCALLQANMELGSISYLLGEINKKMHHAE